MHGQCLNRPTLPTMQRVSLPMAWARCCCSRLGWAHVVEHGVSGCPLDDGVTRCHLVNEWWRKAKLTSKTPHLSGLRPKQVTVSFHTNLGSREKMPVKVFGSPATAEVARVMSCLFEKDVEFQLIRVDSFRGVKRLERPKLHPHGESITFDDGNATLVESRKILRHVAGADMYKNDGNKTLFGPGALERASIEQWLQTEEQNFNVPSSEMLYSLSYLPIDMPLDGRGVPPAAVAGMHPVHRQHMEKLEEMRQRFVKSMRELSKLLNIYDQRLAEMKYLAGDSFTLADLSHLPNADAIASDPRSADLIASRENVSRWWYSISRRESWRRVKELQRPPAAEAPF